MREQVTQVIVPTTGRTKKACSVTFCKNPQRTAICRVVNFHAFYHDNM